MGKPKSPDLDKAYDLGYKAGEEGGSIASCPFDNYDSPEGVSWLKGFEDAGGEPD